MSIENVRRRGGIKKAEEIPLNIIEDKRHYVEDVYYDVLHKEDLIGYMFNIGGECWLYQCYEGQQTIEGKTKKYINDQLAKEFGYELKEETKQAPTGEVSIDEFVLYEMEYRLNDINTEGIDGTIVDALNDFKRLIAYTKTSLPSFNGSQYARALRKAVIESRKSADLIVDEVNKLGLKLSKLHLSRLQNGTIQPATDEINKGLAVVLNIDPYDLMTLAYIEKLPPEVLERLRNEAAATKE